MGVRESSSQVIRAMGPNCSDGHQRPLSTVAAVPASLTAVPLAGLPTLGPPWRLAAGLMGALPRRRRLERRVGAPEQQFTPNSLRQNDSLSLILKLSGFYTRSKIDAPLARDRRDL
jgi:hypothetical protein